MARAMHTGSRIRAQRMDRGVRQADLARACDISASYLNLIEHNRRRIGGALLKRIADALGVDASRLSGGAETGAASAMDAAAAAMPGVTVERERSEDLATRFPGWARLIDAQHGEIRRLREVIERLDDRLTHDPFLSASMHNVLSSVTAIRSASAILAQGGEIEPEWQTRFHRNIYEDSQRLAEATEVLVNYLDADPSGETEGALPQEDFDAWLGQRGWCVEALEDDPGRDIGALIGEDDALSSPAIRHLARRYLERYARDARRVPRAALEQALGEGKADPAGLSGRFGADLITVFRRLATLAPETTPSRLGYGLVACDGAGAMTFRKPLPGIELPRYSAGCPLWPLYEALRRPLDLIRRPLILSGRDDMAVNTFAFAEVSHPAGFDGPSVVEAWMLIAPELGRAAGVAERVGASCRICARSDCAARREPSVFAAGSVQGVL